MTQVFARHREETKMQFFANALKLAKAICRFSNSKKYFSKKNTYSYAQELRLKVLELLNNITYANSIFPTDEFLLSKREYYQQIAIANCFQLQNMLHVYIESIETIKFENMDFIGDLVHEIDLLKGWQKANRIYPKK